MNRDNYIELHSMIGYKFMYIDLDCYIADDIFIENKIKVKFLKDFYKDSYEGYNLCIVKIKKKDREKFIKSMIELRKRCTYRDKDYSRTVDDILERLKL